MWGTGAAAGRFSEPSRDAGTRVLARHSASIRVDCNLVNNHHPPCSRREGSPAHEHLRRPEPLSAVLAHTLLDVSRVTKVNDSHEPSQPPLQLSRQCLPGPPAAVPVPAAPALLWLRQLLLLLPRLRLPSPAPDLSAPADREGENSRERNQREDRDRQRQIEHA
eukprot:959710-Rhodomonas_salina.1